MSEGPSASRVLAETSEMGEGGRALWDGTALSLDASEFISSATTGVEYSSGIRTPKEEGRSYVTPQSLSSVESSAGGLPVDLGGLKVSGLWDLLSLSPRSRTKKGFA